MKLEVWLPIAVGAAGLAVAVVWSARDQPPPPQLARVERVAGQATSSTSVSSSRLAPGTAVGVGERITVDGAGALLTIVFPDRTTLESAGAAFDVLALRPPKLFLYRGALVVDGGATLLTREGDATAAAARLSVEVGDGRTTVRVTRGEAKVEGKGRRLTVGAAQRVELSAAAGPPTPVADEAATR